MGTIMCAAGAGSGTPRVRSPRELSREYSRPAWRFLLLALWLLLVTGCGGGDGANDGCDDEEPVCSLKASNAEPFDWFGTSVALSGHGNTLVVGASREGSAATGIDGNQNNNDAQQAGAAYVFTRGGRGRWSQQAYVKASNTDPFDGFGTSVALSGDGNTLAVGASGEDSAATGIDGDQGDNSAKQAGAAYVFTREENGRWSQQAYVKTSNPDVGDDFGISVALSGSGDTLAIGATGEESAATGIDGDETDNSLDNSSTAAGAVYVFTRDDNGNWSQRAYVKPSNTDAGIFFGMFGVSIALSVSGDTMAVGSSGEDSAATGVNGDQIDNCEGSPPPSSNCAAGSGAVYVFTRDAGGSWSQQAYIKASNTNAEDSFGHGVALSGGGDTLAVGALNEDSDATGIDGDQADNSADGAGAVYVFTRDGADNWAQQAYVKASNTDPGDAFGGSVALSGPGDMLAVGAPHEDSAAAGFNGDETDNSTGAAGAAYVFIRDASGTWSQLAYVKASNPGNLDIFGTSLDFSDTADPLAVGARNENAVYLY